MGITYSDSFITIFWGLLNLECSILYWNINIIPWLYKSYVKDMRIVHREQHHRQRQALSDWDTLEQGTKLPREVTGRWGQRYTSTWGRWIQNVRGNYKKKHDNILEWMMIIRERLPHVGCGEEGRAERLIELRQQRGGAAGRLGLAQEEEKGKKDEGERL